MTTLHLPVVSIIIPIHNEKNNIGEVINDFKKLNQREWEIIVVDDGSKDKTIEMIENFKKNNPNINIQTIYNKNNKGLGFNYFATAHKALGEYYILPDTEDV